MERYFRSNTRRLTFTEGRRLVPSWKVVILWGKKLLGRKVSSGVCFRLPVPVHDFIIRENEVSRDAAARFQEPLQAASRAGYLPPVYQYNHSLFNETTATAANCRHGNGENLLRIIHIGVTTTHPPRQQMATTLVSWFVDGTRLVTSDRRATFNSRSNIIVQRLIGASVETLHDAHRKKLEEMRQRSGVEQISNDTQMTAAIDRAELESFDFQVERGLYIEVPPEEIAALKAKAATRQAGSATDAGERLALAEIQRLQEQRGNWAAGLLVATVSFFAFVAISGVRWNWQFAAILTGVVAFHEFGHFVAMRALHYKDVRMFFVPLVGAAVSGRHYNVNGWQRAVVALAGPVPGILIGCVLAGVALSTHNFQLQGIASLALLINGINLIPVVPLDGGWILHAILFSRTLMLEKIFLGVAGAALVLATLLGYGQLWIYLGILMLLAWPALTRVTRTAARLRANGIQSASIDDQTIPPETALTILREVKKEAKGTQLNRHLAGQTLDIFQRLNATPPGVAASAILLTVYLTAGVLAVAGVKSMTHLRTNLREDGIARFFPTPKHTLNLNPPRLAGATNDASGTWLLPQLVATFRNAGEAASEFTNASAQVARDDRLVLFGDSLFISSPAASNHWSRLFQTPGAAVFLEHPESNKTVFVELTCEAPDDSTATAVESDCEAYFTSIQFRTWPPWASLEGLSAERAEAVKQARYTWPQLLKIDQTISENPVFLKLMAGMVLHSKSTPAGTEQRDQKWLDEWHTLGRREFDRLLKSDDPKLDKRLVSLYEGYWLTPVEKHGEAWKPFTDDPIFQLASVRMTNGLPLDAVARSAALGGAVFRSPGKLYFKYLRFYRTECGMPALVNYLRARGCQNLKYEFRLPAEENAGDDDSVTSP